MENVKFVYSEAYTIDAMWFDVIGKNLDQLNRETEFKADKEETERRSGGQLWVLWTPVE